ncbi:MAG: hypothetical protein HYV02_05120 [Deltaproteobacteria bacterium]|nr:hypothetical protein [Deltaproteobacteria bacterium]
MHEQPLRQWLATLWRFIRWICTPEICPRDPERLLRSPIAAFFRSLTTRESLPSAPPQDKGVTVTSPMKHTKHYYRIAAFLIGAIFLFLIVRAFLIPKSFGEFGFYRADNLSEQKRLPISFAARGDCAACHPDIATRHQQGPHQPVQCQNCHAPLTQHIAGDGTHKAPMPINRASALCLRCHRALPSRPTEFPQIQIVEHTGLAEHELTEGFCIQCHHPHDPRPAGGKHP